MRRFLTYLAAILVIAPSVALAQGAILLTHWNSSSSGSIARANELYSASVTLTATDTGGRMMLFAGTTVPADGTVDPVACFVVPTGVGTTSFSMGNYPGSTTSGLSWAFSSAGNCHTKATASVDYVSIAYR